MPDAYLSAEGITVRFGGLTAVDDVSASVHEGEIVGFIGPNGAGKSTLFGAMLGTVALSAGTVRIKGVDVSSWPTHRRARAGVGRTFQKMELFGSMTVRENLEFATEASALGAHARHLLSRSGHRRPGDAWDVAGQLGLDTVFEQTVAALPIGLRRLVEFGRALCARPSVLLLDEPSSGLDDQETARFAEQIRQAVLTRGIGVLLVEHDMSLVLSLCERIDVLDFGKFIASGTAAEIQRHPAVRDAYLGAGNAL